MFFDHFCLTSKDLVSTAVDVVDIKLHQRNKQGPCNVCVNGATRHARCAVRVLLLLLQFKMLTGEVIKHVRGVCVSQVLGTDMKKHFDILSRFQVMFVSVLSVCADPHIC